MIVVTGMHRSGTSLAALVMQAIGADFGPDDQLYGADDWNAAGYLERVEVVDLNSRAITGHPRTAGRAAAVRSQLAYMRMPATSAIDRRLDGLGVEIDAVASALGPLVVKDPRFCLTLGGWRRRGAIDALAVAIRHPSASVASLRRRNRLPARLGHRFWGWHMRALLPYIDEHTLVIRQDRLVGPDHDTEVDRIGRWLRARGVAVHHPTVDVIDRTLVHHEPSSQDVPAANLEVWEALLAARAWEG